MSSSRPKVRRDKRLFDLIGAGVLMGASAPLLAGALPVLWVESRLVRRETAPLLFRERRVSRGRDFDLLKLRTVTEASLNGERRDSVKQLEAHRENLSLTGRVLKKWYLDELPQLVNIVKGEMSIVGPRPWVRVSHDAGLASGDTRAKEQIPCGLVGPSQMNKSAEGGRPDLRPELDYLDCYERLSPLAMLRLDLGIILESGRVASRGEGY